MKVKARIDSDDEDVTVELRIRKDNLEQLSSGEPKPVEAVSLEQREDGTYQLWICGSPVHWKPTQNEAPAP